MPARLLYSLALWLALPLVALRLLWRARRQHEYLHDLGERFGFYRQRPRRPLIWLHAVSVGEVRAAEPLLRSLARRHPGHALLVTCMTPTGRATTGSLVASGDIAVAYLPYDYAFAMRRFLAHFRPQAGLILETEVWPNLLHQCALAGVPLALVNARLSERSHRRYRRWRALSGPAFAGFDLVAAQTAADAARFRDLGSRDVAITGNLKFDVDPAPELLARGRGWREAVGGRRVVLAASTREGEEALLMPFLGRLAAAGHLAVLVPRHPQRFDEVAALAAAAGLAVARRSTHSGPPPGCALWLGDSMGEMAAYFAMADCAFVGGSLMPLGGQNLIEAAACGCPILIGPHTWNFAEAARAAVAGGAARRVADVIQLESGIDALLADGEALAAMRLAGLAFARQHGGATARTLDLLAPLLHPAAGGVPGVSARAGR